LAKDVTVATTSFGRGGELSIINTHLVAQLRATSVNCRLSALFQVAGITSQAMAVSVRIIQQMRIGFLLAEQGKVKPFANVLGIRGLGNELRSEFLHQAKHLFTDGVDEHYFREIDY